jgi:hypothetical protein
MGEEFTLPADKKLNGMKRIYFLMLLLVPALLVKAGDPTEKVKQVFNLNFPGVSGVSWYEQGDEFQAYFNDGSVACRVSYDKEGNLLYSRRYYSAGNLSPFLLGKLMAKYPGKEVYGITEISGGVSLNYYVVLRDDKKWYHCKMNSVGEISNRESYSKG